MSSQNRPIIIASPVLRMAAVAALMGTTMLASPLTGARAEPIQLAQTTQKSPTAKAATDMKPETVESRITKLHADLKITPNEEQKWTDVAQAMRDNAAAIEKLIASKRAQAPQSLTAVDDLNNYQEFAQAHVDGLKNLTSSFKTLYDSMPDVQKKNADQVFQSFGRASTSAPNQG
jgi:periplasmic protein CpxP/Spy